MFKNLLLVSALVFSSMVSAQVLNYAPNSGSDRCKNINDESGCSAAVFYSDKTGDCGTDQVCLYYKDLYNSNSKAKGIPVKACQPVYVKDESSPNKEKFEKCEPADAKDIYTNSVPAGQDKSELTTQPINSLEKLIPGNPFEDFEVFVKDQKFTIGGKDAILVKRNDNGQYGFVYRPECTAEYGGLSVDDTTVTALTHMKKNKPCFLRIYYVNVKAQDAQEGVDPTPLYFVYSDKKLSFLKAIPAEVNDNANSGKVKIDPAQVVGYGEDFCTKVEKRFHINAQTVFAWAALGKSELLASDYSPKRLKFYNENATKQFPSSIDQYSLITSKCFKDVVKQIQNENSLAKNSSATGDLQKVINALGGPDGVSPEKVNALDIPEAYKYALKKEIKSKFANCVKSPVSTSFLEGVFMQSLYAQTTANQSTQIDVNNNEIRNFTGNIDRLLNNPGAGTQPITLMPAKSAGYVTTTTDQTTSTPNKIDVNVAGITGLNQTGSQGDPNAATGGGSGGADDSKKPGTKKCQNPTTGWQRFRCSIDAGTVTNTLLGAGVLIFQISEANRKYKEWKDELAFAKEQYENGACYAYKNDTSGTTFPITIAGKKTDYSLYDFCRLSASGALAYLTMNPCSVLASDPNVPQAAIYKCYNIEARKRGMLEIPAIAATTPPVANNNNGNNNNDTKATTAATTPSAAGTGAAAAAAGGSNKPEDQSRRRTTEYPGYSQYSAGRPGMQQSGGGYYGGNFEPSAAATDKKEATIAAPVGTPDNRTALEEQIKTQMSTTVDIITTQGNKG